MSICVLQIYCKNPKEQKKRMLKFEVEALLSNLNSYVLKS